MYHTGHIPGFSSLIMRFPEHKHSIILLNNSDAIPLYEIGEKIQAILFNQPFDLPRQSINVPLLKTFEKEGTSAMIAQYKTLNNDKKSPYINTESEINRLGYQLLQRNQVDAAIAIFELNVAAYPDSFNTYDSLAEAFMTKGEKNKAIEFYKKSLEHNPDNDNAKKMLQKLGG
jgi:tetratricopeptide (TPR) repeat protein